METNTTEGYYTASNYNYREIEKIRIQDRCEPYMLNTKSETTEFNIGDIVDVEFGGLCDFIGDWKLEYRELYVVNNLISYSYGKKLHRLCLVPLNTPNEDDNKYIEAREIREYRSIVVDDVHRFKCLEAELYPENWEEYRGCYRNNIEMKKVGQIVDGKIVFE